VLEKSSIQVKKRWSNLPEKQTQEFLAQSMLRSRIQVGFLVFLFFLCAAKAIKKAKNFYRKDAKTAKKQNASWIPCLSFLP